MTLGALRPVTRRVLFVPTWKTGSATDWPFSAAFCPSTPRKSVSKTPCEPNTSFLSERTEVRSSGFASLWKGKVGPVTVLFGPGTSWKVPSAPGLTPFFVRPSAPAWKWQVAHACMPSLPTCMSQNSALPRLIAALRSLTKFVRLAGSGMGTALSGAGAKRFPGVPACAEEAERSSAVRAATAIVQPIGCLSKRLIFIVDSIGWVWGSGLADRHRNGDLCAEARADGDVPGCGDAVGPEDVVRDPEGLRDERVAPADHLHFDGRVGDRLRDADPELAALGADLVDAADGGAPPGGHGERIGRRVGHLHVDRRGRGSEVVGHRELEAEDRAGLRAGGVDGRRQAAVGRAQLGVEPGRIDLRPVDRGEGRVAILGERTRQGLDAVRRSGEVDAGADDRRSPAELRAGDGGGSDATRPRLELADDGAEPQGRAGTLHEEREILEVVRDDRISEQEVLREDEVEVRHPVQARAEPVRPFHREQVAEERIVRKARRRLAGVALDEHLAGRRHEVAAQHVEAEPAANGLRERIDRAEQAQALLARARVHVDGVDVDHRAR